MYLGWGAWSLSWKVNDGRLAERGIGVSLDLQDKPYGAVLVIGGTRDLSGLWRARRRGIRYCSDVWTE